MKIYCPHCGVKGSADDSYSGRTIKCPKCEEMFELTDDMAIDHNEFLTADHGSEGPTETVPRDKVEEEVGLDSPVSALADIAENPIDELLDLGDEQGDALDVSESTLTRDESEESDELAVDEEDSLDWGDFGAELDKEIADSEAEEATAEFPETDQLFEERGPVEEQDDLDSNLSLHDSRISEDQGLAGDLGDILRGGPEIESGVIEEVVEENIDIEEEITEAFAAEEDPIVEDVISLETIEGTEENDDLGASTTPDVVVPLFVDDETNEDESSEPTSIKSDEELAGERHSDEVIEFADTDLTDVDIEAEEEPDLVIEDDFDAVEVVEDEPYGFDKEQCWQCGKKDSVGEPFIAVDGRLYCTDCLPAEEAEEDRNNAVGIAAAGVAALGSGLAGDEESPDEEGQVTVEQERKKKFTVGGVVRESWEKVKGIKGSVWAGSALMYLVLIVVVAGGAFLLPDVSLEPEGGGVTTYIFSALFQVVTEVVSMLFIAGLLFMGIRHVAGDEVSWKMIFHGFSFTGKIIVVSILQFLLVTIGFLLLILPGIYLVVGYAMAIPLIVDKNLSPWQALETSRKAVHKVWWKVAALYIVMSLIFLVALIPLGIGVIWVWPMMMVAAGVVYHRLFKK